MRAHPRVARPTDNLLIFYLPGVQAIQQMQAHNFFPVSSLSPYWGIKGKTFEDPDGYRVVLQNASRENTFPL